MTVKLYYVNAMTLSRCKSFVSDPILLARQSGGDGIIAPEIR